MRLPAYRIPQPAHCILCLNVLVRLCVWVCVYCVWQPQAYFFLNFWSNGHWASTGRAGYLNLSFSDENNHHNLYRLPLSLSGYHDNQPVQVLFSSLDLEYYHYFSSLKYYDMVSQIFIFRFFILTGNDESDAHYSSIFGPPYKLYMLFFGEFQVG